MSAVMVEGGASVFTSFLREKLADRLVIIIAPKIIGHGTEAIGDLNIDTVDQSYQLDHINVRTLDDDIMIEGDVRYP